GRHVGVDEPGRDHVDGDAARTVLARQGAGEADETGLGGRVVGLAGLAEQADHGGDEDDAAAPEPHHGPDGPLGDAVGAREVGVDDVGEGLLLHHRQEGVLGDAGVGDQDLDRALLRLDLVEGGLDVGHAGHVAPDAEEPLRRLSRAVGDGDGVAGGGEFTGDREAYAAIASGDEYRASHDT